MIWLGRWIKQGGVTSLEVGQMVADLTVFGAYTEYMLRPADALVPVPAGLDPAEAVSMVLSYVTAYQMLHRVAKIRTGQNILVHGAGGRSEQQCSNWGH